MLSVSMCCVLKSNEEVVRWLCLSVFFAGSYVCGAGRGASQELGTGWSSVGIYSSARRLEEDWVDRYILNTNAASTPSHHNHSSWLIKSKHAPCMVQSSPYICCFYPFSIIAFRSFQLLSPRLWIHFLICPFVFVFFLLCLFMFSVWNVADTQ